MEGGVEFEETTIMSNTIDKWSNWFNVDRPVIGLGDYETVSAILRYTDHICGTGYSVATAQCRRRDQHNVFDQYSVPPGENLFMPCTTDGLICRNDDQPPNFTCSDYSIRFGCRYMKDLHDDDLFPEFDVRIYIVLAIVPVLIFTIRILWAYVFRRRRQRRREARRARRRLRSSEGDDDDEDDDDVDSSSIASALAMPPPSYNELFQYNNQQSSVFAISGGSMPICENCKSKPCSVVKSYHSGTTQGSGSPSENEAPSSTNSATTNNSPSTSSSTDPVTEIATSVAGSEFVPVSSAVQVQTPENAQIQPAHHQQQQQQQQQHQVTDIVDSSSTLPETRSTEIHIGDIDLEAFTAVESNDTSQHNEAVDLTELYMSQRADQDNTSPVTETQNHILSSTSSTSSSSPEAPTSGQGQSSTNSNSISTIPISSSSQSTALSVLSVNQLSLSTTPPGSSATPTDADTSSVPVRSASDNSELCLCACHKTMQSLESQIGGRGISGYENGAYIHDGDTRPGQYHVRHVPALPRVWSNLSNTSVVTLSELPSYEAALELLKKKKEAESLKQ